MENESANLLSSVQYAVQESMLSSADAYQTLVNLDHTKLSHRAPFRPTGGQLFIYPSGFNRRNILADGYRWVASGGYRGYPNHKDPLILRWTKSVKTKAKLDKGDDRFRVYLYKLPSSEPTEVLVHYVGDSSIAEPMPHGRDEAHPNKDWFKTAGSVLAEMKSQPNVRPQEVYDDLQVRPEAQNQPACAPRDLKQVRNHQYLQRLANQLTQDHLYNTCYLGWEFRDFAYEYRAVFQHQNNLLFLASRPLLNKLNRLLKPPATVNAKLVDVLYDTTFSIGHFYVSTLTFRHYMFSGRPTIPCAFLIHQRKFEVDHISLFQLVAKLCPNTETCEFTMITDREFTDFPSTIFKKAHHYYCWIHLLKDVARWTSEAHHQGPDFRRKGDTGTYCKDVNDLLRCESAMEFDQLIIERKPYWGVKFISYFELKLESDLRKKACLFSFAENVEFDSWNGVSTNAAESMNRKLKDDVKMQAGRPRISMPEALLVLLNMTKRYDYEIDCGMACTGKYQLDERFIRYKENILDLQNRDVPIRMEDIVDVVRGRAEFEMPPPVYPVIDQTLSNAATKFGKANDSAEAGLAKITESENITVMFDKQAEKPRIDKNPAMVETYQVSAAQELVKRGKVTLVAERQAFLVEGSKEKYCVTLFPKESCQCPATTTCYHILAARFAVGMKDTKSKGRKNTFKLFQNTRKRAERGTLGKRPKRNDYRDRAEESVAANVTTDVTIRGTAEPMAHGDQETTARAVFSPILEEPTNNEMPPVFDENEPKTNLNVEVHYSPFKRSGTPLLDHVTPKRMRQSFGDENTSDRENATRRLSSTPLRQPLNETTNSIHCICRQRYDGRREMAQCERCLLWFHRECLNIPGDVFKQNGTDSAEACYWECKDCWIKGASTLGGRVVDSATGAVSVLDNTCPLDSVLTIIHAYEKLHPNMLPSSPEDIPLAALKECLQLFRSGNYAAGKLHWINFIIDESRKKGSVEPVKVKIDHRGTTTFNAFGDPRDSVFGFLGGCWILEVSTTCSNRICLNKSRKHRLWFFALSASLDTKRDGSYDICKCLARAGAGLEGDCNTPTQNGSVCSGKRKPNVGRFGTKSPFLIPIDLQSVSTVSEIPKLPMEFGFDKRKFKLGGIVLHNETGRHFEALIARDGDWYHGNGYRALSKVSCDGFSSFQSNLKLSTAMYFLVKK